MSYKDLFRFFDVVIEIEETNLKLKTSKKKGDPKWIILKRRLLKLQKEKKVLVYRAKFIKKSLKDSDLFKKEKTFKDKALGQLASLIFCPLDKFREYSSWVNFPAIETRSMHALERSRQVKDWLKYPTLRMPALKYPTLKKKNIYVKEKNSRPQ